MLWRRVKHDDTEAIVEGSRKQLSVEQKPVHASTHVHIRVGDWIELIVRLIRQAVVICHQTQSL